MAKIDALLKEKVAAIAQDAGRMKTVREWIAEGYKGKVIAFATPEKSYHVVFKRDGVSFRAGDYPSCESRYVGSEKDLIALLQGETNAYLGARTGRLIVWGNLNDATVFERLLQRVPLTARECVDLIVTDLAVIEVTDEGLVLKQIAPGWMVEEVQSLTESRLTIARDLKEIEL